MLHSYIWHIFWAHPSSTLRYQQHDCVAKENYTKGHANSEAYDIEVAHFSSQKQRGRVGSADSGA